MYIYIIIYVHILVYAVKGWLCGPQVDSFPQKMFMKLIPFVHLNTKSCYFHCYYMTYALFGNSQGQVFRFPLSDSDNLGLVLEYTTQFLRFPADV